MTRRSHELENESADVLADNGYRVQQNPDPLPNGREPDYKIEGKIFDAYSPRPGTPPRNVWRTVEEKLVQKQRTDRVVLNLTDWNGDADALRKQFTDWPMPGLKEVIVTRGSRIIRFS